MAEQIKKRDYDEWMRWCQQVQASTGKPINDTLKAQTQRKQRALRDYNFFVKTYFPKYCDNGQTDCGYFHIEAANEIAKDPNILAVLEWPREHAKSVHATIFIPMWLLAKGELTGMILMGKNQDDACNLLSDVQAQLQNNELYAHDFGEQFSAGSWTEGDFSTQDGIRFLAIGRDQSPRGARDNEKRPNYAVCDDVDDDILVNNQSRVQEIVDRITGALLGALSLKGGRLVIAGNRIHPQSVLAHMVGDIKPGMPVRPGIYHSKVFATEKNRGEKCYIENGGKPAWERYSLIELERRFKKQGILASRKEYYHEHTVEGSIFKDSYLKFKPLPKLETYKVLIGYLDPSFENKPTSDFKAIAVWGVWKDEFHCIKRFVRRCELTECFTWMAAFQKTLPKGIGVIWYVEKQFFNRPVQDALRAVERAIGFPLNVITDLRVKENKYTRMVKMEPRYTQGKVFYNIDEAHDPDMQEGNNQLKAIEPGYRTADDSPDADEGAWFYLQQHLPENYFQPVIRKQYRKNGW